MKAFKIRLLSAFAALSLCIGAVSGCGNSAPAGTSASDNDTGAAVTNSTDSPASAPLSNPVAMTADGDVDMDVALSYETDFDALIRQLDEKTVSDDHPVSDNTNPETLELYRYLKSIYGKQVLSAQMILNERDQDFLGYYYYTEDLPAIKGFDFIFTTTSPMNSDGSDWTQLAIDWHTKSNGICVFCWHWNVPCDMSDPDSNAKAFYTTKTGNKPSTDFSIANAVTPGTEEYKVVVHDIDLIAYQLQRLEAAGVPVLWRPLHEASGDWFWWGITDKESVEKQYYQKLWYMIFDRLENYHKLTNLIWVWNGQTKNAQVHQNTYDIAGIDVYPNTVDHSVLESSYSKLEKISAEGKMLALTECGYIPDSDELAANMDSVKWLYYMPWNSTGNSNDSAFVFKGSNLVGLPLLNEDRTSVEMFRRVMASDTVITWSELPDFDGTERELPERIKLAIPDIEFQKQKDAEKAEKAAKTEKEE